MRPGGPRPWHRGALSLWLALVTVPAAAQVGLLNGQTLLAQSASNYAGNHLAADGGFIFTDNVNRTASGSSQMLLLLGLSGDVSREGTRLDYRLASNLALLKYLGGAYSTQPTGFLDGTVFFKVVPGFFSWNARETYVQLQINPFAPVTPDNVENVNYFTTGPRFTMRPTLRTSVTIDALYSYLTSSSQSSQYVNIDNQRYGGDLRIDRAFSEAASLYIKGNYDKVDFKDQVINNNFSLGAASGGYRLSNGRTSLDISGGYSKLHVYDVLIVSEGPFGSRESRQDEEFETPVWGLDLSRLITPSQRVALHASQQFSDPAQAFRLGFEQSVPTVPPPRLATGEAFKQRSYALTWLFQASRTSFGASLSEYQERYVVTTGNDRNVKLADLQLNRRLNPVLSLDIVLSYQNQEQVGAGPTTGGQTVSGQSSKSYGAVTDLRWQVGERLSLRFIYAHSRQTGVYSDNQIGITASYSLIGAQPTGEAYPGLAPVSRLSTQSPYR